MTIKQRAGKAANRVLRTMGYQIGRITTQTLMESGLARRAQSNLQVGTIIDIGASDGRWSRIARHYFPTAYCFLIEANQVHAPGLQRFKAEVPNSDYQLAAAGDSVGEIYFEASDPFGGAASHSSQSATAVRVPLTTIDQEVRVRKLAPPYLLKLDTHGFEVPIFNGASETLKQTSLIIVEVYNFRLNEESLTFWEMCRFLEEKGFRPIDLCEPAFRPKDQALWQMDIFFLPSTSQEFGSNSYA